MGKEMAFSFVKNRNETTNWLLGRQNDSSLLNITEIHAKIFLLFAREQQQNGTRVYEPNRPNSKY